MFCAVTMPMLCENITVLDNIIIQSQIRLTSTSGGFLSIFACMATMDKV